MLLMLIKYCMCIQKNNTVFEFNKLTLFEGMVHIE